MHWSWREPSVDVMIDPVTNTRVTDLPLLLPQSVAGTPYLTPGQTIDIGLVKFKSAEQPPKVRNNADPLSLVNGETIATKKNVRLLNLVIPQAPIVIPLEAPAMTSGDHVLLYYVASSPKQEDTFFRHGIYVLNTDTVLGKATIPEVPVPP
jgi:hypothetical protein